MTRSFGITLASLLAAGCPSDGPENPRTLYLAPDMVETRVKLVPEEPPPF